MVAIEVAIFSSPLWVDVTKELAKVQCRGRIFSEIRSTMQAKKNLLSMQHISEAQQ